MSIVGNVPLRLSAAGEAASPERQLEDPAAIMESLIIGTGFDIAMVQNGLLPPRDPQPEDPTDAPGELPLEPPPIELAAIVDASAMPLEPSDQIWWLFGFA